MAANPPVQTDELRSSAKELVGRFAGQLKPALQQAFRDVGPAGAIEVCSAKAPAIAASLSEESGWRIRRVSLKPRNTDAATPNDWARRVLESFEQRRKAGEPVSGMVHDGVVDGEYRFMKPQAVEPLCLTCHGTDIAPDVARQLDRFYPDDRAIGYSLGDIRGAFYLTKSIDTE
ncbi:MAG: DUF3365 domain-containing protein [Gammaproteobacteria bacterium]|nr:DUF3365 domain-containing protein [Gammaproteobacteria bacterium]